MIWTLNSYVSWFLLAEATWICFNFPLCVKSLGFKILVLIVLAKPSASVESTQRK